MHTSWKGKIQFGLVNIPIRLHAATEDKDIKLKLLHRSCGSPINYKKVCSQCKGYHQHFRVLYAKQNATQEAQKPVSIS